MKAKYKAGKDDLFSVEKTVKALNRKKVNVGCLEGSHAWLAAIHEYGCRINVTPKMRAYLHSQGFHLKKSTTTIVIPERSFIRAGYDKSQKKVLDKTEALVADVVNGKMSEEQFLKTVGIFLSSEIKEYATNLNSPSNHPFTQSQKGSSNPLWDTGQMIRGITYEVK